MTIYRGCDIKPYSALNGAHGFIWTNERDCDQFAAEPRVPFATEEKAMDAIDAYKRAQAGLPTAVQS